jgi:hypothetical protein
MAAQSDDLLSQGSVDAEFELGKEVGKGAFATVYRARHRKTGSLCAVKRVRLACLNERALDNCLKEVGLLRGVNHENIVRYMDSFIDPGHDELVIALEWAEVLCHLKVTWVSLLLYRRLGTYNGRYVVPRRRVAGLMKRSFGACFPKWRMVTFSIYPTLTLT